MATRGPHVGLERKAESGQDAWSLDGIYCSEGSLSFKVLNINPHTLAGADAKNKAPSLQEIICGELDGECEMDKTSGPKPEQTAGRRAGPAQGL